MFRKLFSNSHCMLSSLMCLLFVERVKNFLTSQSHSYSCAWCYQKAIQKFDAFWPVCLFGPIKIFDLAARPLCMKRRPARPLCVSARAKNEPAFANKVLNARKAANNNFSITPCALSQIFFSLSTLLLAFLLREETRAILWWISPLCCLPSALVPKCAYVNKEFANMPWSGCGRTKKSCPSQASWRGT